MPLRKVKYDSAAPWRDTAPCLCVKPTNTKEEVKAAIFARLGHATLFLQDSDGDFVAWDEPIELPANGTICVKVVNAGGSSSSLSSGCHLSLQHDWSGIATTTPVHICSAVPHAGRFTVLCKPVVCWWLVVCWSTSALWLYKVPLTISHLLIHPYLPCSEPDARKETITIGATGCQEAQDGLYRDSSQPGFW